MTTTTMKPAFGGDITHLGVFLGISTGAPGKNSAFSNHLILKVLSQRPHCPVAGVKTGRWKKLDYFLLKVVT